MWCRLFFVGVLGVLLSSSEWVSGQAKGSARRAATCAEQLLTPWQRYLFPLAQFMATAKMSRSPALHEFFFRMKNDAEFRAWVGLQSFYLDLTTLLQHRSATKDSLRISGKTVVLDLADLQQPSPLLVSRLAELPGHTAMPLSVYHELLLSLERGDQVNFKSAKTQRRFRLSRFLGAGDATYVWEIEGQRAALRIPKGEVASLHQSPRNFEKKSLEEAVEQTGLLVERTINDRPPHRSVRILEVGPENQFVSVEAHSKWRNRARISHGI